jgi:hypothetical protein
VVMGMVFMMPSQLLSCVACSGRFSWILPYVVVSIITFDGVIVSVSLLLPSCHVCNLSCFLPSVSSVFISVAFPLRLKPSKNSLLECGIRHCTLRFMN